MKRPSPTRDAKEAAKVQAWVPWAVVEALDLAVKRRFLKTRTAAIIHYVVEGLRQDGFLP